MNNKPVVILGAGPAGLATTYELIKQGVQPVVLEKADKVGGIARTEIYKDYYFDIGGHRFFTKIDQINKLWHEMLGENFQKVRRMSRIYYEGRLLHYPLSISNTLFNLGIIESFLMILFLVVVLNFIQIVAGKSFVIKLRLYIIIRMVDLVEL